VGFPFPGNMLCPSKESPDIAACMWAAPQESDGVLEFDFPAVCGSGVPSLPRFPIPTRWNSPRQRLEHAGSLWPPTGLAEPEGQAAGGPFVRVVCERVARGRDVN